MPAPRRLIQLSRDLDQVISFSYGDDDDKPNLVKPVLAAGAGVGGVLAHQAIKRTGGYAANAAKLSTKAAPLVASGKSAISGLYSKLRALTKLSARLGDTIEFKDKPTEVKEKVKSGIEKLKALKKGRKGRKSRAGALSSALDDIIQFAQAPDTDSWNPIKRHRQNKELKQWVANRPPSAGVTSEQLEKKYPATGRGKRLAGAITGGVAGTVAGIGLHHKITGGGSHSGLSALAGSLIGAGVGEAAVSPKHWVSNISGARKDLRTIKDSFKNDSVSADEIKAPVPVTTSHRQVTRELKKQGVGFLKRQTLGLATFPARHTSNAAFVPAGKTGVIVSGKKVPKIVAAHESGHAKDYAHYGGEKGFKLTYPHYGNPFVRRKTYIQNTLLPEERAWSYARPKSRKDKSTKDAALRTYARAGFFSSMLDDLIQFKAIDLGYTYGDGGPSVCSDEYNKKRHFPSLYVSDLQKDIDLPLSGEAKVKFKLRSKTARQDEAGNKKHSADIEIHSIDVIDSSTKKPKEGEKAKLVGLSSIEEEIEFGKAGRLGALAALLGTLAVGTAEHGKILSKFGGAKTAIEAKAKSNSLDALEARSKALAGRTTAERMQDLAKAKLNRPSATPTPVPVVRPTAPRNTQIVVARDAAREERDAAMAADAKAAKVRPTPSVTHGASGLTDPGGTFKKRFGPGTKQFSTHNFALPEPIWKAMRAINPELAAKAVITGHTHRGKIGIGAGFLLGRKSKKKKTDQGGSIPGDSPGSTSELSAKLDELLLDQKDDLKSVLEEQDRKKRRQAAISGVAGLGLTIGGLHYARKKLLPTFSSRLDSILNFEDPRSRNKLGEFSGQQQEGVDPNAMNIVYRQGQRKGLHQGIVEGAAAGAAGGIGGQAIKSLMSKLKKAKA